MTTLQQFYASLPDLRNGDPTTYNVLHVASGIPAHYHVIAPGTALPDPAVDIKLHIRVVAAIYAAAIKAGDPTIDDDGARGRAAVLACCRLGMTSAWKLRLADYIAAQVNTPAAAPWNPTLADDLRVTNAAARAHFAAMDNAYFDDGMVAGLMRIGYGVLVTCGVILVKTEGAHHYVAPHKPTSQVLYNQVFGRDSAVPFGLTMEVFEDMAFHKTPHPVVSQVMTRAARDLDTKVRLRQADLSGATVRVPALYPPEASASAFKAVAMKAKATGALANVAVEVAVVIRDCDAVTQGDMSTPALRSAAVDAMAAVYARYKEDVAYGAGLLAEAADSAGGRRPALLSAKILIKAMAEEFDAFARGQRQMSTAMRAEREKARRGIVKGVGLFGATPPPDTEPLPADEQLAQILTAVMGVQQVGGAGASAPAP